MPVRKDDSAAKPSRRSDEYAFQPHPPLTRSPFPDLGEGFKLNRSSRLQNEETPKPSLLQREKVANARITLDFEFKVTKRLTDEVLL